MHNRDLIWKTRDGRKLKIKEISSNHLENILTHIDENLKSYILVFGKEKLDYYLFNIKQEIRYRKLNRINIEEQGKNLF
jgi:ribosome biogenesis GTPase A